MTQGVLRTRRVFLLGGSNTVDSKGWTKHLRARIPADMEVVNLACGATTSLMGIYRFLSSPVTPAAGDIVIWEYAINERAANVKSWKRGKQPIRTLRYQLQWLIKLCHDQKVRFLPVVFCTQNDAERAGANPYLRQLMAFLNQSGIPSVSSLPIVQSLQDTGMTPDQLYSNNMHFDIAGPVPDRIAQAVVDALAKVDPLSKAQLSWLAGFQGKKLLLANNFGDCPASRFENSRFRETAHAIDQKPAVAVSGLLIGCILIASAQGNGVLMVSSGRRIGPFSTQPDILRDGDDWLLKQICVQSVCQDRPFVIRRKITFARPRDHSGIIAQPSFGSHGRQPANTTDGIVAVLVETHPHVLAHTCRRLHRRWTRLVTICTTRERAER